MNSSVELPLCVVGIRGSVGVGMLVYPDRRISRIAAMNIPLHGGDLGESRLVGVDHDAAAASVARVRRKPSHKISGVLCGAAASSLVAAPIPHRSNRGLEPELASGRRVSTGETESQFGEHPLATRLRRIVSGVAQILVRQR